MLYLCNSFLYDYTLHGSSNSVSCSNASAPPAHLASSDVVLLVADWDVSVGNWHVSYPVESLETTLVFLTAYYLAGHLLIAEVVNLPSPMTMFD